MILSLVFPIRKYDGNILNRFLLPRRLIIVVKKKLEIQGVTTTPIQGLQLGELQSRMILRE